MTNSRRKGKDGELELARILRDYGFDARRGQQYSGANGDADVVGLPGIHIEVKRYEVMQPGDLYKADKQAMRDADSSELPVVFYREDRKKWHVHLSVESLAMIVDIIADDTDLDTKYVTLTLDDFIELYREARKD